MFALLWLLLLCRNKQPKKQPRPTRNQALGEAYHPGVDRPAYTRLYVLDVTEHTLDNV